MKPLFCALALFTILAPALAQDAATPPTTTVTLDLGDPATLGQRIGLPRPTLTKDEITITAIERPVDHVAAMLDINLWQFKVEPPKPTADGLLLHYSLQLQRSGRDPIEMDSGGRGFAIYGIPRTLEFTLGLKPESGKSLEESERLELYIANQIWNLPGASGASSSHYTLKNSLKDFAVTSLSPTPNIDASGNIVLMDFKTDGDTKSDTKLVLVLTADSFPTTK